MKIIIVTFMLLVHFESEAQEVSNPMVESIGNVTKLLPENTGIAATPSSFGKAIDSDGVHLVVGASDAPNGGGASIYRKEQGQWQLIQLIDTAPFPNVSGFGNSVSVDGDKLMIGASDSDINQIDSGAVLYFKLKNERWEFVKTIVAPVSVVNGIFGLNLTLKGDTAVISSNKGVNLYHLSGDSVELIDELIFEDTETSSHSYHMALSESYLAIGQTSPLRIGAVYIYDKVNGQWSFSQKLGGEGELDSGDMFGYALSIESNRLAIGEWFAENGNGAVHVYAKTGTEWQLEQLLTHPEGSEGNEFGWSVDFNGDQLLVGAFADSVNAAGSGAAYLFQLDQGQWMMEEKFFATDGQYLDRFGNDLLMTEDEVIVAAYRADSMIEGTGQVYQFKKQNNVWQQTQILFPKPASENAIFGNGLATNEGWVAVGADGNGDLAEKAGVVYLYKKSGKTLAFTEKLYPPNPESDLRFGKKILMEEDFMLISSPGNGVKEGLVHFYQLIDESWVYQSSFNAANTLAADNFGYELSMDNDLLAVTATYRQDNGNTGAVYLFEFDGNQWIEQEQLSFSTTEEVSYLGIDVALSGDRLVVGSYLSGYAYLFEEGVGGWVQKHELSLSTSNLPGSFGRHVELQGERLIIGSIRGLHAYQIQGESISAPTSISQTYGNGFSSFDIEGDYLVATKTKNNGSIYPGSKVFYWDNDSWQFLHDLPVFHSYRDYYVNDVSLFQNQVIVGNYISDERGTSNGAAYWIMGVGDVIFENGFELKP